MQRLGLHQKLIQKLSPQQIQLMKLLQVPTAALEQRIKEELEINPALEEGSPDDIAEEEVQQEDDAEDEFNEVDEDSGEKEERNESPEEAEADALQEAIRNEDVDIADYIVDDDVPYYKLNANNSSADDERPETPITVSVSYQDNMLATLSMLPFDDHHYMLAQHLIGSLDDDGYLRRELEAIVDDLAFTQNIQTTVVELEDTLKLIQTLDPPGIAARDLRECLMLQLERKHHDQAPNDVAYRILKEYMEEFSKKHYEKIQKGLSLDDEELKEAIHEILLLNPRPGGGSAEDTRTSQQIIPDFILTVSDNQLDLTLNSKNDPDLRISRSFQEMLSSYSKDKKNKDLKEAVTFIKSKIDAAKWFIDAIKQRQHTLLSTMTAIMNFQKDYFMQGDETELKPMILRDIADMVGLDISTVSRVANSKYVETPYGTFLLKSFFSEGLQTDTGEEASSREIKKILTDHIGNEDKKHPLPDEKLAEILNKAGYNIARRTVAKYREQLNIPVARLRKEV
ncbi:MAG: RNA polymerase factor sigma-54 [Bacteroidetes bacterium]|nr:RNA polymerase factor sigma-54 [Bacteroidota bacterium]